MVSLQKISEAITYYLENSIRSAGVIRKAESLHLAGILLMGGIRELMNREYNPEKLEKLEKAVSDIDELLKKIKKLITSDEFAKASVSMKVLAGKDIDSLKYIHKIEAELIDIRAQITMIMISSGFHLVTPIIPLVYKRDRGSEEEAEEEMI